MDTNTLVFEAAVSANEVEADFIPVGVTQGFRWTSRAGGRSRVVLGGQVGRLWSGDSHILQHGDNSSWSLLLTRDDEFISVGHEEVCNILFTESSEELHSLCVDIMSSFTRRSKLTVVL